MDSLVEQLRALVADAQAMEAPEEFKPAKAFEKALCHLDVGELEAALALLLRVEECQDWQGENRASVYHLLGDIYAQKGKLQWAEDCFLLALGVPEWQGMNRASTYLRFGLVLQSQENKEAYTYFQKALEEPTLTDEQRAIIEKKIKF